jgi:hypothetical protein
MFVIFTAFSFPSEWRNLRSPSQMATGPLGKTALNLLPELVSVVVTLLLNLSDDLLALLRLEQVWAPALQIKVLLKAIRSRFWLGGA